LEIVGITFPSSVPYDGTVKVMITVRHEGACAVVAAVYYAVLFNQAEASGTGWRIVEATLVQRFLRGNLTLLTAIIPNPAYQDRIAFGATIVFYVEVIGEAGDAILSCRKHDRWNPYIQDDKYLVVLTDPHPPSIEDWGWEPKNPNSQAPVKVWAKVSDGLGAGVSSVELVYSVDGSKPVTLPMDSAGKNVYESSVPPQAEGKRVTFYVVCQDMVGNKKKNSAVSYMVLPSPSEIRDKQLATFWRQLQIGLVIVAIASALLCVAGWAFSRWSRGVRQPTDRQNIRETGLAPSFVLTLLLVGFLCFELLKYSMLSAALAVAGVLLLWGFTDPRVDILLPFRMPRRLREKPPLTIAASSYVVLVFGGLGMAIRCLFDALVSGQVNFQVLTTGIAIIMKYSMVLLGTSIVLQLLWPYLRSISVSVDFALEEGSQE